MKNLHALVLGAVLCGSVFSGCSCDTDPDPAIDAICGNGVVEPGEACDDGNDVDDDACNNDCGNVDGECGNGTVEAGEECDDGNLVGGDGCTPDCMDESGGACGDGVVDAGEDCDDANANKYDGCEPDCTPSPDEVTCETLSPLSDAVCEVTAGSDAKLISGNVLMPHTILRGGQVLIDEGGEIVCADCDCSAEAGEAATIVCPEGVVSPGLINSHDHITFIQNDPYNDTGERYEHRHEWRKGINGHTKISSSGGASDDQIRWGELRFLVGGATSTIGSGSASGFLRNLDRSDQEGLGQPQVHYETFPLGDSGGTLVVNSCNYPDIDTKQSISGDDAYFPHIAEGVSAAARNEFLCVTSEATGEDLLEPQSAFIHAIGLTPLDYARMQEQGTSLVWSPRSNITLYGDTAVVTVAARLGVRIALGTDWMPTGSMNMQRELHCADSLNETYYDGFFTDRQLWLMVTRDAAGSAAVDDAIGTLAPGLVGDVAIFDGSTNTDHRAVIDALASDVALVLRSGEALFGDDDVVNALVENCSTMAACGVDKRVCSSSEIGKSYDDLAAQMSNLYPLFFCGEPDDEPSCVPTRPAAVNGSTVYSGTPSGDDNDGDGIDNADDNCADVFNPIRPLDNGVQADFDNDGDGDACDVCPLDADVTDCAGFSPEDVDADGIVNSEDNCPEIHNPGQEDDDNDQKGDACDACPGLSNPGDLACPASIYDIKAGIVTGEVALENKLVTACGDGVGVFLQATASDDDYDGPENSGIFIFYPDAVCSGGSANVKVGDRITVNPGTAQDFFGQTQVANASVEVVTSANESLPDPVLLSAAAAGGEVANTYEAVLVTVEDVLVSDSAPTPGPGDSEPTGEFEVDNALRIDNLLYEFPSIPLVGSNFISITGVLNYRNGNSKLEPRDETDVVEGPPLLVAFSPGQAWVREGVNGTATIPAATPLTVTLSKEAEGDTFIAITSDNETALTVVDPGPGTGVIIDDGQTSGTVMLNGLVMNSNVTLTASLETNSFMADVRVLGDDEVPTVIAIEPNTAKVDPLAVLPMNVVLDFPAQLAGNTVTLGTAPGTFGSVPGNVIVDASMLTGGFDFTATALLGTETLTATLTGTAQATVDVAPGSGIVINEVDYDQPGGDTDEFIELFNTTSGDISLADLRLVLVNGNTDAEYDRIDLSVAGTLGGGEYLVIGTTTLLATITADVEIEFDNAQDNVQNGAPDAIGLIDISLAGQDAVLDAISYEGAVTAGDVMGIGVVSFVEDEATAALDNNDDPHSLVRIPNGSDTQKAQVDWSETDTPSPGAAN